jgi:hypothetical protein
VCASSEFDVFADRPVQTSIVRTIESAHNPTTCVDQRDIEFTIPGDADHYIDPDMQLYIKGQLLDADGVELDNTNYTAAVNNMLHSLFEQCNMSLNSTSITPSSDNYNYRSYFETILTYGSDASSSHLTNAYWYLDNGNVLTCDPTDTYTDTTNRGFITRWNLQKQSKVIELVGRLHADICNASTFIIPGVPVTVRLKSARREFYLLAHDPDSKVSFQIQKAQLLVRHIKPNPAIIHAHNTTLDVGGIAKYHVTRVDVKTFRFAAGSTSLSIDNAVLGTLPKRLLFTLVKNKDSRYT